jgi:hypothetical protein
MEKGYSSGFNASDTDKCKVSLKINIWTFSAQGGIAGEKAQSE